MGVEDLFNTLIMVGCSLSRGGHSFVFSGNTWEYKVFVGVGGIISEKVNIVDPTIM